MSSSGYSRAIGLIVCALTLGACDDATGPEGSDQVAIRFAAVTPEPSQGSVEAGSIELTGSNGILRIDELHIIVAEFELKLDDDDMCDDDLDDDDCDEFEAPPAFVNVPLDGSAVVAVQNSVDAGTYREFEFEIEDLDDDEDDAVQAQQIAALRTQILAQFADWPDDASMLVVGTFTPTDGDPVPFRVYFEAEIEIEMEFDPPVVIDGSGDDLSFTVRIDTNTLFGDSNGTVRNLANFDFDLTGHVIEFEVEIEDGFTEIEFDD